MFKVSVIVPVYNVEKYLKECLDSICNQTLTDIEIICINDGSTDDSLNILNEYQSNDSRIKVISQENQGVSKARNVGLDNAGGEYIYFADSDDYMNPGSLEKLYALSQDKNLDLVIFKLVNFDDKSGERDYDYSNMPFLLEIGKDVFDYTDFKQDLFKVDVTTYTKFFKRELIEDNRFAEGLIFEDNAFYIDYILDAKRIHFLDECLYNRRLRENSLISRASKNHSDIIRINEIIADKFKDRGFYDEFREKLFMRKVDSIYYRYTLINPKYQMEYYHLMKDSFAGQIDEYKNEMNLNEIDSYHKNVFEAVNSSNYPNEIKGHLKLNRLKDKLESVKNENKKLKKENRKLKKANKELTSFNSNKITNPFKKLKRK